VEAELVAAEPALLLDSEIDSISDVVVGMLELEAELVAAESALVLDTKTEPASDVVIGMLELESDNAELDEAVVVASTLAGPEEVLVLLGMVQLACGSVKFESETEPFRGGCGKDPLKGGRKDPFRGGCGNVPLYGSNGNVPFGEDPLKFPGGPVEFKF
jgi:hypothetical protein